MSDNLPAVDISPDEYKNIYKAIETVYRETKRKPKNSEVIAVYNTTNAKIAVVLADWDKKHAVTRALAIEVKQAEKEADHSQAQFEIAERLVSEWLHKALISQKKLTCALKKSIAEQKRINAEWNARRVG